MIYEITTESQFANLLSKFSVVVVDVYATWCMPCQAMSSGYDELAEKFSSLQVAFAKCDVEKGIIPNIPSVPTINFYINGVLSGEPIRGADLEGIRARLINMGVSPLDDVDDGLSPASMPESLFRPKRIDKNYKTYGNL